MVFKDNHSCVVQQWTRKLIQANDLSIVCLYLCMCVCMYGQYVHMQLHDMGVWMHIALYFHPHVFSTSGGGFLVIQRVGMKLNNSSRNASYDTTLSLSLRRQLWGGVGEGGKCKCLNYFAKAKGLHYLPFFQFSLHNPWYLNSPMWGWGTRWC